MPQAAISGGSGAIKITLVSTSSGSRGGGELYLNKLARGLTDLGHSVETWLSDEAYMDELAEIFHQDHLAVSRFPYRNTYRRRTRSLGAGLDQRGIRELTARLNATPADLVHVNQQCVEDGLDLVQAAAKCRVPAVSTIHVTRSMRNLNAFCGKYRDMWARSILRRSALDYIGISHTSAQDLSDYLDLPDRGSSELQAFSSSVRVHVVPNGVPTPETDDRERLRLSWGIPREVIVLGCIARIEQQKNPLFAARLLAQLPENVHFVWVGDGRERPQLEATIASLQLTSRFHLLGWQHEASRLLSAFDIFILPSFYEGLPLAMLEAMSLGLPVVVSDVDGTRDAIENQQSGYLMPVSDLDCWAGTLRELSQNTALRKSIGRAGQARQQEHFSLLSMAEQTVNVYQQALDRQRTEQTEPLFTEAAQTKL